MKPEDRARVLIDDLLLAAGWHICDMAQANIHAAPGVALREFPLNTGHGVVDYLLGINHLDKLNQKRRAIWNRSAEKVHEYDSAANAPHCLLLLRQAISVVELKKFLRTRSSFIHRQRTH